MKRLHVHLGVEDADRSVAFYSALFGAEPTLRKPGYARWMLDDPRVNFAISQHCDDQAGVSHLGIQAEDADELAQLADRIGVANGPVNEEGETTCCYARSVKSWTADPDGVIWEAFLTHGDSESFGRNPALQELAQNASVAAPDTRSGCCPAS